MDYNIKLWREFYRHILPNIKVIFLSIHEQAWFVFVCSCACVYLIPLCPLVSCVLSIISHAKTTLIVYLFFQLISNAIKFRIKYCIIIIVYTSYLLIRCKQRNMARAWSLLFITPSYVQPWFGFSISSYGIINTIVIVHIILSSPRYYITHIQYTVIKLYTR